MSNFLSYDLLPIFQVTDNYIGFPVYRLLIVIISFYFWDQFYIYAKTRLCKNDIKKAARVVPLAHAIFATLSSTSILITIHPIFTKPESYCAPIKYCEYIFSITYGYFIWDVKTVLIEKWSKDYLIHALFCLYIFSIVLFTPILSRPGIIVLFYEFSTIFLHCYIFLHKYEFTQMANFVQKLFALSFVFCRLIVGSYVTVEMWEVFIFGTKQVEIDCIPKWLSLSVIFINALFHILNMYWFWMIIKKALGLRKHKIHPNKLNSTPKSKSNGQTSDSNSNKTHDETSKNNNSQETKKFN